MSIAGSKVGRDLNDLYVVMRFRKLGGVGGRSVGWQSETGSTQSFLQALSPCPRLRFQIQPRVLDPLEAVLALLDNLVENPLASI